MIRWTLSSVANLEALLNLYQTRDALRADLAFAQQDMRALVGEDRMALAELSQTLGAAIDRNAVLITVEREGAMSESGVRAV